LEHNVTEYDYFVAIVGFVGGGILAAIIACDLVLEVWENKGE